MMSGREHRPGDVVAGRYVLDEEIGSGAMGTVYVATHIHLQQRVAVKIGRGREDPVQLSRFFREARAAARLSSPHVVRVSDVSQLPTGEPFTVMELLDGESLHAFLSRQRRIAVGPACRVVLEVLDGIGEAHACGIVHRDLKPANLFIANRAQGTRWMKVLDFGIAKLLEERPAANAEIATGLTGMHERLGSPAYMAPEQIISTASVDARADLWSIGVVLYEMLVGSRPFRAGSVPELYTKILAAAAVDPPSRLCPGLPAELESVILRCLERDPRRRFATASDLAAALAPFADPTLEALDSAARRPVVPPDPDNASPPHDHRGRTFPLQTPGSNGHLRRTEPLTPGSSDHFRRTEPLFTPRPSHVSSALAVDTNAPSLGANAVDTNAGVDRPSGRSGVPAFAWIVLAFSCVSVVAAGYLVRGGTHPTDAIPASTRTDESPPPSAVPRADLAPSASPPSAPAPTASDPVTSVPLSTSAPLVRDVRPRARPSAVSSAVSSRPSGPRPPPSSVTDW